MCVVYGVYSLGTATPEPVDPWATDADGGAWSTNAGASDLWTLAAYTHADTNVWTLDATTDLTGSKQRRNIFLKSLSSLWEAYFQGVIYEREIMGDGIRDVEAFFIGLLMRKYASLMVYRMGMEMGKVAERSEGMADMADMANKGNGGSMTTDMGDNVGNATNMVTDILPAPAAFLALPHALPHGPPLSLRSTEHTLRTITHSSLELEREAVDGPPDDGRVGTLVMSAYALPAIPAILAIGAMPGMPGIPEIGNIPPPRPSIAISMFHISENDAITEFSYAQWDGLKHIPPPPRVPFHLSPHPVSPFILRSLGSLVAFLALHCFMCFLRGCWGHRLILARPLKEYYDPETYTGPDFHLRCLISNQMLSKSCPDPSRSNPSRNLNNTNGNLADASNNVSTKYTLPFSPTPTPEKIISLLSRLRAFRADILMRH